MFYEKLSLVTLFRRQSYIFYIKPKKRTKKNAPKIFHQNLSAIHYKVGMQFGKQLLVTFLRYTRYGA